MIRNVGGFDRVLRIVAGLVILGVGGFYFRTWWALIGVVPLTTGLTQNCPVYIPFKFSTNKVETKKL